MALEREMLPNRLEAREKFLCSIEITEAAHAALAFARGLMAVLGPGEQPTVTARDAHLLDEYAASTVNAAECPQA